MTYQPDLGLPQFYLTTHRPNWLWDGRVDFPVMVSYRTLRTVKELSVRRRLTGCWQATVPEWSLDSGGFMELSQFGRWTINPREYVEAVARYDAEIGRLAWCPVQDWMCEPQVIYGGTVGGHEFPGTRQHIDPGGVMSFDQLVEAHQRATIESYHVLTGLWPEYSDAENPFMPVLQGWEPWQYEQHYEMYAGAGIDLASHPVTGIGSVCRRSNTAALAEVAVVVNDLDLASHWFGIKLTALETGTLAAGEMEACGEVWPSGMASFDTASWSKHLAREPRLPGCTHVGKDGGPSRCGNCPAGAAWYRETKVMPKLRAAQAARDAGVPVFVQPGMALAAAA